MCNIQTKMINLFMTKREGATTLMGDSTGAERIVRAFNKKQNFPTSRPSPPPPSH